MLSARVVTVRLTTSTLAAINPQVKLPELTKGRILAREIGTRLKSLPINLDPESLTLLDFVEGEACTLLISTATRDRLLEINQDLSLAVNWLFLPIKFEGENLMGNSTPTEPDPTQKLMGKLVTIGCIAPKERKNGKLYYYWHYYRRDGSLACVYLSPHLTVAIQKANQIGIPADANPTYKRRKC